MGWWSDAKARARQYDEIADVSAIARRYFAMNAFDGVVTIIGVLAGAMVAGVTQPDVVVVTGLTTAMAMGISGFTGAFLTEAAERERTLQRLERPTLLTAVAATRELFGGAPFSELGDYFKLMGVFDVVFVSGGLTLFGTLVES